MILYFSGTGNSRFAAQIIQKVTRDEICSMNKLIKSGNKNTIKSEKPFVFVCPTYAWRIPKVVDKFIKEVQLEGSTKAYFILTCGDGTGNALSYAKKLCIEKGLEFMGLASVIMPENYTAMFNTPDKAMAERNIKKVTPEIFNIGNTVKEELPLKESKPKISGIILSNIINPIFYSCFVNAKGFYSTNKCISCGKCVDLCPLNNIKLIEGKPQWGRDCTHCMACINRCPKEAIEYKNNTKGKPRYYLDNYSDRNIEDEN